MSKPKEDRAIAIPPSVIRDLLTNSEWRMLQQRLIIVELLQEGLSIRAIAERVGVGTDTVVRMKRKLEESSILKNFFKNNTTQESSSKWIFGKVGVEEE